MTNTKKTLRRNQLPRLPFIVFAAAIILATAGCNSDKTVKAPSAGGVSGTEQILNNPTATPQMKAQAAAQQQMGQQQAQALQQAHAHELSAGQTQGH